MKPILITCQPIDEYFVWQNHLYIESCIERGFTEDQIHILLYKPLGREHNNNWNKLKQLYPDLNIFVYEDKGVQHLIPTYIPVLRPHILWQHFLKFPELENKTIIYTDCDILWLENLNIQKFYNDDVNYVSDAKSYLNYSYFESKKRDILEHKKEEASKRDFLQEICDIVGINKQIIIDNNNSTGGVQYILKNVNASFWKKIEEDVIKIRKYFISINKEFYKNENSGIQSWCADLWAVLWNLWILNKKVETPKELDFAWSTDNISKINTHGILHNAGIIDKFQGNSYPAFYKGAYHSGQNPFLDEHLKLIINNKTSKNYCTYYYTQKLLELNQKYNLTN